MLVKPSQMGITASEFEELERERDDELADERAGRPDDEIVAMSPVLRKFLVNLVRAGDQDAIRILEHQMRMAGAPRNLARHHIAKLRAMGPAPAVKALPNKDSDYWAALSDFARFMERIS